MLRYDLAQQCIKPDSSPIVLREWHLDDLYGNDTQSLLVCKYVDDGRLHSGSQVALSSNLIDVATGVSYPTVTCHSLAGFRHSTCTFTIIVDKYEPLNIRAWFRRRNEDNDLTYITFREPHYFVTGEGEADTDSQDSDDSPVELFVTIEVWFPKTVGSLEFTTMSLKCKYVSPQTLSFEWPSPADLTSKDKVLYDTLKQRLGYEPRPEGVVESEDNFFDIQGFSARRRNHRFSSASAIGVTTVTPTATLRIPMGATESISGLQEIAVQRDFVEYEKAQAINDVVDMEKDVYYPVNNVGGSCTPVYRIVFNLHFREHEGEDWQASTDTYWNGTKIDERLGGPCVDKDYFVYDDPGQQSDLLGKLGFIDDDVHYQKSRLKRSFLRLLFYDSPNPTNQTLLYTSTIFYDINKAYAKYLQYEEDGISVLKEPTGKDERNSESHRLSSQFVVEDPRASDTSGEGFYLYLWREGEQKRTPTNIYMRVEFNHAGFGRTIPFMAPFWDTNKWKGHAAKFKTFDDICRDWQLPSNPSERSADIDGEYGIKQYLKYSYIRLCYRYDKDTNQHVYYLDDKCYADSIQSDDTTITLNLYEAKMI